MGRVGDPVGKCSIMDSTPACTRKGTPEGNSSQGYDERQSREDV